MSNHHERQIEIPSRLGRYILLCRLTEGGMTEVYAAKLAEDVGPGRILVIKLLPRAARNDPDAESRFLEEARIVLNLTHGNITAAFEFARDDEGRPFLVMEYVPGPSLSRLCAALDKNQGPLDIPDALFIIGEVCKALSYAHSFSSGKGDSTGIIHRDISPDNIVISTSGQVKLTDFGIAEFMQSRAVGPIFGKPAYIAPEIAGGAPPTAASDLYSTGAVLYECLTGKPPFKGASDKETLALAASEPPPSPSSIRPETNEALDRLVLELLDKDPGCRPKSAALVEVRIRSLLQQLVPEYTESKLAETVGKYFQQTDFTLFATKESLRAALLGAGVSLSGQETTDDLLSGGTVRLGEPELPEREKTPVRNRISLVTAGIAVGVIGLLAMAVVFLSPFSKTEPVSSSISNTETAEPREHSSAVPLPPTDTSADTMAENDTAPTPAVAAGSDSPAVKKTLSTRRPKKKETHSTGKAAANPLPDKTDRETEWGWLNINSYPWSYVAVDGERLSGHTPYRRIKLKTGTHTLVFENPELQLKDTRKVTVAPWEETTIGVRLK